MTALTQKSNTGRYSTSELFKVPDLDIYQQMICVVLSATIDNGSTPFSVSEIASLGRMSSEQATNALQDLVDKKILTHKAFRQIVGDFGDHRLSWAAKGILAYLKENPNVTFHELVELSRQSIDDEQIVRVGLEDLKRFGYLEELTENADLLNGQLNGQSSSEVVAGSTS